MGIVRRRKAAASNQQIFHFLRDERTKRNADALSIGKVLPFGIATGVVIFDGRAAETDLVVELARAEYIFPRKNVLATNSPRFADSNLRTEGDQFGFSVSGNFAFEETQIFQGLAASFDFGIGQQVRIGRVAEFSVGGFE